MLVPFPLQFPSCYGTTVLFLAYTVCVQTYHNIFVSNKVRPESQNSHVRTLLVILYTVCILTICRKFSLFITSSRDSHNFLWHTSLQKTLICKMSSIKLSWDFLATLFQCCGCVHYIGWPYKPQKNHHLYGNIWIASLQNVLQWLLVIQYS